VLSNQQLRELWLACNHLGPFGAAVQFMTATGQRRSEVGKARWSEIDLLEKVWRLPAERTKAGRSHEIPLNNIALRILADLPRVETSGGASPYVFTIGGDKPINSWSKSKARLEELTFGGWHLHDLRRTVATNMGDLDIDRAVIGALLNHADPTVTAIYDRGKRKPAMRAAMDRWGKRLEKIIDPKASDVVQFPARA
jgi:integrase